MSRVIRTENAAAQRTKILQAVAATLREASASKSLDQASERDIFAFLALSLEELKASVEATASAWERRSYWLKADRFRQEWDWVPRLEPRLTNALGRADFDQARGCGIELATLAAGWKLKAGKGSATPWRGAWHAWQLRRGQRA